MNEPMLENIQASNAAHGPDATGCPRQAMPAPPRLLKADDELVFPQHKRAVTHYATDASGGTELHLY